MMQYTLEAAATFLARAPFGSLEGKRWKTRPLRRRLTVVPFEEITRHRRPSGRGNTNLNRKNTDNNEDAISGDCLNANNLRSGN